MVWSLNFSPSYSNEKLPPGSIRIVPTNSNWNDFSYNFNALITVTPSDAREPLNLHAYVVPVAHSVTRLQTWISEGLNSRLRMTESGVNVFPSGQLVFATLLASERGYSELANWSQDEIELESLLLRINDVVWLGQGVFFGPIIEKLLRGNKFALGVLRSPSAYRAMRRGLRSLQGLAVAGLSETRKDFVFRTYLHGFEGRAHELSVEFRDSGLLEDRIHCLIGVNGVGKTRLLRELVLTLGDRARSDVFEPATFNEYSEATSENEYVGEHYTRLLVFSTTGDSRFPAHTNTGGDFEYQYFSLAGVGDMVRDRTGAFLSTRLIVDLIRDDGKFGKSPAGNDLTRLHLLKRTLRDCVDLEQLYIPVDPSLGQDSRVYEDESGQLYVRVFDIPLMNEQRRLEFTSLASLNLSVGFFVPTGMGRGIRALYLSSGQNLFFRFALRLISCIDKGTLVIIDEPETHLHPNLICELMTLLYSVLEVTKSVALVATHSAYVVREVPTHCAHVCSFVDDSRQVEIGHVRMKTLGASIESISQAVFGDATVKKFHEKLAREVVLNGMSKEAVLERFGALLSPELLIEIRTLMAEGEKY